MKRGPMPKRKAPLRKTSEKRDAENRTRATAMRWVAKRSGGRCEAAVLIATVDAVGASECQGSAVDGHERRTRGRGGSITDPRNIVHVCPPLPRMDRREPGARSPGRPAGELVGLTPDIRKPFAGWVEREIHLAVEHDVSEGMIGTLDSREARDLHRWLHSQRDNRPNHVHEEW